MLTPIVTCWSGPEALAAAAVGAAPLAAVGAALVAAGAAGGVAGAEAGAQPRTDTTSRLAARRAGVSASPRWDERTVVLPSDLGGL